MRSRRLPARSNCRRDRSSCRGRPSSLGARRPYSGFAERIDPMLFSWRHQLARMSPRGKAWQPRARCSRLEVETLEDRTVLSFAAVPPSFPTGPDPHAVVAADFAGSGRLDLAVVNEQSNTVSVFPGNGDGAFQPKVDYTVGTNPDALAAGDFNGDGRPDLAVVNLTGSVSVLLNGGAGAFLPAVGFAVPSGSHSVAVADFNGDGHADLVVNHSLLLGNGDGTFQPATTLAANGAIVATGDFNGDGKPDLASAVPTAPGLESVLISLGNGDGTFQAPQSFALDAGTPMAVAVADFNGDGRPDLAVTNDNSETVSALTGNGDGAFGAAATYYVGGAAAGTGLQALVAGDFTGDGRPDFAVTSLGAAFQAAGAVSVVRNNGDGAFAAPVKVTLPGVTVSQQAAADFNGDGIPDKALVAGPNQVNVEL